MSGGARDEAHRASVLRERARRLAQVPGEEAPAAGRLELLAFRLGRERYAFETRHVVEVHGLASLSPLPCAPAHVAGIMNARGRVLPVLRLERFLGLPPRGIEDHHRVIQLRAGDVEAGILADLGVDVVVVGADRLQRALPAREGRSAEYLVGVDPEGLIVLDAARILGDPRLEVNEEVGN